jgi:phospholipid/cholesterol/gamma-HCH transport system substrate-binding protein
VTDGYCDALLEREPGVQEDCEGRGGGGPPAPSGEQAAARQAVTDPSRALARRDVERAQVGAAVGPVLGVPATEVPDLAVLLFGPVARGTTVGLAAD